MSDALKDLILARESSHIIRQVAMKDGMVPMLQDAMGKILTGVTSIEEALRVIEVV
jgi:type II secretory ATPase GspE/PulE/Tfp pilus assembly ATPase PilB-like protein